MNPTGWWITIWFPGTRSLTRNSIWARTRRNPTVANKLDLDWDELLGGRRTGVVFLDARRADNDDQEPPLGTQALIQLTDLGLVWKKSPTGVDVFVFSHRTGQPVAGATARLFSDENQPLREAVADTNGVATWTQAPMRPGWRSNPGMISTRWGSTKIALAISV